MSKKHPYEYFIDMVTKRYFDALDHQDLQRVLECFDQDAFVLELASDSRHEGRDRGVKRLFRDFFAGCARIWHGNLVHTVDVDNASICSQYSLEITDKEGRERRFENANRFYLKDGLFREVYVYMSADSLSKKGR